MPAFTKTYFHLHNFHLYRNYNHQVCAGLRNPDSNAAGQEQELHGIDGQLFSGGLWAHPQKKGELLWDCCKHWKARIPRSQKLPSFKYGLVSELDVLMRIVLYSYKIHKSVFYRTQVNLGSDLWVRMSLTPRPLWNLTELTLADDDTNPILTDKCFISVILTDNANRATWWPTLQAMQVAPPDDQMLNQSMLCHLVAKYAIYIQVAPSGDKICN